MDGKGRWSAFPNEFLSFVNMGEHGENVTVVSLERVAPTIFHTAISGWDQTFM